MGSKNIWIKAKEVREAKAVDVLIKEAADMFATGIIGYGIAIEQLLIMINLDAAKAAKIRKSLDACEAHTKHAEQLLIRAADLLAKLELTEIAD